MRRLEDEGCAAGAVRIRPLPVPRLVALASLSSSFDSQTRAFDVRYVTGGRPPASADASALFAGAITLFAAARGRGRGSASIADRSCFNTRQADVCDAADDPAARVRTEVAACRSASRAAGSASAAGLEEAGPSDTTEDEEAADEDAPVAGVGVLSSIEVTATRVARMGAAGCSCWRSPPSKSPSSESALGASAARRSGRAAGSAAEPSTAFAASGPPAEHSLRRK